MPNLDVVNTTVCDMSIWSVVTEDGFHFPNAFFKTQEEAYTELNNIGKHIVDKIERKYMNSRGRRSNDDIAWANIGKNATIDARAWLRTYAGRGV